MRLYGNQILGPIPGCKPVWFIQPVKTAIESDGNGGNTTYEIYTSGVTRVRINLKEGGSKIEARQGNVEILKTVTTVDGTETLIERFHALGTWDNRKTLTYVPIDVMLDEDEYGGTNRLLR